MASLASLNGRFINGYDNLNGKKLILNSWNGRPHTFKNVTFKKKNVLSHVEVFWPYYVPNFEDLGFSVDPPLRLTIANGLNASPSLARATPCQPAKAHPAWLVRPSWGLSYMTLDGRPHPWEGPAPTWAG